MANYNTTLYAAQDEDRVNPARLPAPNQAGGGVQMAVVPYALTEDPENDGVALEAANDTINLCVLPAGAIPIPGLSFVDCEDPGTTLTLDIGYASNHDALAAGITLSAGGHFLFTSGTMPADALVPAGLSVGDTTIVATVASATALTAEKKVVFHIAYKVPA